jgi:hypothetical protein
VWRQQAIMAGGCAQHPPNRCNISPACWIGQTMRYNTKWPLQRRGNRMLARRCGNTNGLRLCPAPSQSSDWQHNAPRNPLPRILPKPRPHNDRWLLIGAEAWPGTEAWLRRWIGTLAPKVTASVGNGSRHVSLTVKTRHPRMPCRGQRPLQRPLPCMQWHSNA